ncbi:hypothetical protein P280DRAFT_522425 [Massarina eburnea CBS 473.64]|uniref:Uncharacterized protein n=1 Tax=Massarina eburnea CBS 473.64 TaxID=1395130 RepID=A0A6A6RLF3_9PLEO|nr:hypothetical protein P280DRAFT_522425 [Massarina eburnea CBS 473.64]
MADPTPIPASQSVDPELLQNGASVPTTTGADIDMPDPAPVSSQPVPQPLPVTVSAATPAPTPVAAPTPTTTRNSPHLGASQPPSQPYPHGSPTRVYLNQHVTPHLLEAMKHLATNEPEKPLKFLSEFLAQKSAELEG